MDNFIIPDRIRGYLYVLTSFLAPTLFYLQTTGKIDDALFALGMSYITVIGVIAKINTPSSSNK